MIGGSFSSNGASKYKIITIKKVTKRKKYKNTVFRVIFLKLIYYAFTFLNSKCFRMTNHFLLASALSTPFKVTIKNKLHHC